jgi:DNA-binding NarL/FixJ family response regulator
MTVRVAVVGRWPMYARGLAATLSEHGHPADIPAELLDWAQTPGELVVFLTLMVEDDWAALAALRQARGDAVVVGVLDEPDLAGVVRAVAAGVSGVLSLDAPADLVGDVLRAVLNGQSLVPTETLRLLVAGTTTEEDGPPLSTAEIGWLRELAAGTTVARLAEQVGYSERMMFRLLAGLYARLGATGRTAALMRARDAGWL